MSAGNYNTEQILSDNLKIAGSQIETLERERDELRAEVESLKADKARIDWLAETTNGVCFSHNAGKPVVSPRAAFHAFSGDDLRKAIDAAMKGDE